MWQMDGKERKKDAIYMESSCDKNGRWLEREGDETADEWKGVVRKMADGWKGVVRKMADGWKGDEKKDGRSSVDGKE